MLKWLSGARPKGPQPAEVVTDDPLATIHVAAGGKLDGPLEIYAVSRVNPIFDEGGGPADRRGGGRCDRGGSSGYGSSGGGSGGGSGARSPCASSSGGASPKQSAPPTPEQASPTRTPATTAAVRCAPLQTRSPVPPRQTCPPPASPRPPPPQARPPPPDTPAPPPPGGGASSRLCPIPEGRPVAVPRPVWPLTDLDALDALYAALAKHSADAPAAVAAAAAPAPPDHASDSASSSASSGFGDDHPPSLSARLVPGERCSSTSKTSSREKLLTARSDAGAGVGVGSVCRAQHAAPLGKRPGVATATAAAAATVAASGHWPGVTPGDVCLQSKDGILWKPDFTLDKAAAERLMRNIQKAKRRRCVCHAATSFLGLAVFLVSVMLVSLAMTGGRRYFGSL